MHATEVETHRAARLHRCDWCWQEIEKGSEYRRYRFWHGRDAGTVKLHPECHGSMLEKASEEGGWFEWTPGMERPVSESVPTSPNL